MKKKVLIIWAAMLAMGQNAFPYDFSAVAPSGQTLYYNISGNTVTVTYPSPDEYPYSGYTKPTGSLVIPSNVTYNGISYAITSIGDWAFSGCSGLTSVTIPNSVTSIGECAFVNCSGLTSVTIPNSITLIGDEAFCCSGLTSVTIPNSVTSIGIGAFSFCSSLTSVSIPNSVTSIGSSVFYYCSGLTSVSIPNSVTSIGFEAFSDCSGLTSVTIGNSVATIGEYAFENCSQIINIHMHGSNPPMVNSSTFENVPSSANLYVPCNATTAYENAAFWHQFNIDEEFSYNFSATSADQTKGMVQVIHAPECGNLQAEVQATPYNGFHFVRWSDGNTDAHRYLVVVQDTAIQAEFAGGSEGIGDVDAMNAKIYINNGQIVVDGTEGNQVWLYDVNGRLLATKQDNYTTLRFDVQASGAYLVKIGKHPARRVVVIR